MRNNIFRFEGAVLENLKKKKKETVLFMRNQN